MYNADATMRDARARYFEENHFGVDGGYNDAWVELMVGPVPLGIPNTAGRKVAVQYHDLHHILTGYRTDWAGEFEISAWEIGAGCRDMVAAWVLNLGGMAGGALLWPRRTFAAFVRGRRSRSLYGEKIGELLDATVGEVRAKMAVPADPPRATAGDYAAFALAATFGGVMGGLGLAVLGLPFLAFSVLYRATRQK